MKRILLLLAICSTVLAAKAQTFSAPKDSIFMDGPADDNFRELTTYIYTESETDLLLNWRMTYLSMPEGWSFTICDNSNCYDGITYEDEFESFPINSNEEGFYKIAISTGGVEGCGIVKVLTFERNNEENNDTYTFAYCSWATGINKTVKLKSNSFDFAMFPNPATNNMTLTFADKVDQSVSVKVLNLLGQEQTVDFQINDNLISLDLAQIRNGNYLVQVVDENGSVVTKRITKR